MACELDKFSSCSSLERRTEMELSSSLANLGCFLNGVPSAGSYAGRLEHSGPSLHFLVV